jgi:hypothetical protein
MITNYQIGRPRLLQAEASTGECRGYLLPLDPMAHAGDGKRLEC